MNRKFGVIISYVYMIFEVLSTLLLTPLITKSLGVAEFGVYKLVTSVSSYLLLLDLGLGNATIRYMAKYRENDDVQKSRNFLGVCIIYYGIIAAITLILGVVLILFFPKIFAEGLTADEIAIATKLMILTIVNIAISFLTSAFMNTLIAYSKYGITKGISILSITIRIIFTYIFLQLGYKSIAIVSINLGITIAIRLFYVLYVIFRLKIVPKTNNLETSFVKEIFIYSSFVLLQMIATHINSSMNQVLLGSLVQGATAIIAVYGVGLQVTQYFQSIGGALGGVLMPGVVKMVENKATPKDYENEMIRIGRFSTMILSLILVCFLINGQNFISLWLGNDYKQAYFVALMCMCIQMVVYAQSIGNQILWAMNKHKHQSILRIVALVPIIVINILLIKWNPLFGATFGTFMSTLISDVIISCIAFKKDIKINIVNYFIGLFKELWICVLISGVVGYLTLKLIPINGWIGFMFNVFLMVSIYFISLWFIGFNSSEKIMFINILRKFRFIK